MMKDSQRKAMFAKGQRVIVREQISQEVLGGYHGTVLGINKIRNEPFVRVEFDYWKGEPYNVQPKFLIKTSKEQELKEAKARKCPKCGIYDHSANRKLCLRCDPL